MTGPSVYGSECERNVVQSTRCTESYCVLGHIADEPLAVVVEATKSSPRID